MSVHMYVLEVAKDMRRRLDVPGLEGVRDAQVRYQGDQLAAGRLPRRKRRRALRDAEDHFRQTVDLLARNTNEEKN